MSDDRDSKKPKKPKRPPQEQEPDYRRDDFLRDLRKVSRHLGRDRAGRSPRGS